MTENIFPSRCVNVTLDFDDMITTCDTQDFVPFGRHYVDRRHPGKFQLQVQNHVQTDHGLPLYKSFRDISIQDNNSKKEQWQFKHDIEQCDHVFDEELYITGNTVVWSRGGQDGTRSIIKTYTVDTPVIQSLWCSFILPDGNSPTEEPYVIGNPGENQTGICVVESGTVNVFLEKGGEYNVALPFQVANTWVIKNGLLFERTISPTEVTAPKRNAPNQTTVFSMLHPLDEVAPVITKTSASGGCPKVSYLTDNTQHIVFTSIEPSIVFTYDTMVGVHSAWRVRVARAEESNSVCGMFDNTSFFQHGGPSTPNTGLNQSSNVSSHSRFINISGPSPAVSPMRNYTGRISSPGIISRNLNQSPNLPGMAAISRSVSPAVTVQNIYRLQSPSPHVMRSPGNYFRTPPVGSQNVSLINESYSEWVEPIKPEICFEHLWTEPAPAIRDGSLGKAVKAFLMRDLCGQRYLCYNISYRQQIRCVKFEESNDLSQLIFGAVSIIPAKDAIPIQDLDLLVVLDTNGILWVYSGITKINRLHVPTLPLGSASLSMLQTVTPINSPSRGGIFTSSRPPSAVDARFDEEMTHISPVQTELEDSTNFDDFPTPSSYINGLRDNIGTKFTIELINGRFCRTSMPNMTSSPGINLCLQALKHVLPKDTAIQVIGKWYTAKNTPGGLGNQSEWILFTRCLLSMLGYDITRLALTNKFETDASMSPVVEAKRSKPSDQGSEDDWEHMLNSDHHRYFTESVEPLLGLPTCKAVPDTSSYSKPCSINTSAVIFVHIPSVFMALHLVYEEMKLNTLLAEELDKLVPILFQIACDMKVTFYIDYYSRDFPHLHNSVDEISQITEEDQQKMSYPGMYSKFVPSVHQWIINNLHNDDTGALPYIPGVCNSIKNVISLYALLVKPDLMTEHAIDRCLRRVAPAGHRAPTCDISMNRSSSICVPTTSIPERIVLYMTELGMTKRDLEYLPVGIALPFREAIFHCRCSPPSDWPEQAYVLIGRQDLSHLMSLDKQKPSIPPAFYSKQPHVQYKLNKDDDDGMEHLDEELLRLRFSEDLRVQEVRRLLQSSRPARIAVVQRPEVSDHDFIEEQERLLYSICIRTMALPVGRGMFTLFTYHPLPTEVLPIPKLCLTGRAPPRNATVDLTHIDTPPNMSAWPQFHNGVAAGLRIANSSQVDSTWIIYNKPKSNELTNEYAGVLMALGLNGHLINLHTLNVHDYLSKGHEMTTIGLLLGLSAAKRGSMDLNVIKMLSIHVPALLPPTSTELNVPHNVQVAGILGVGLVYQGTAHRHTAEVLLTEIGRPPGPEMENCSDRESYSLAAGLALGLVMFGKGSELVGMSDLGMADTLYHYMVGGHKRPVNGLNKDRYKSPSYQIKEGDVVNVNVTSPGATLALGMLYFKTNNIAVSEWLSAADTQFMLDHVRPDFLLLRTLSRGLVMWDSVTPTFEWIKSNIPPILQHHAFNRGQDEDDDDNVIDYETMSQAYCNIVAGGCMVMGLKFAGTANKAAFDTLMECMKVSQQIMGCPGYVEQAGKSTVENCMMTVLLSLAMVMSGTGNLEVLRMCRMFRARVGPPYNLYVMYGSQMAISLSLGLLFLGGGRYSLCTTEESIPIMLSAFFPKFPIHSNDNRYHLQAFRHLYVLAAEPRLIVPRDVDTGLPCYVPVEIRFRDTEDYRNVSFKTAAPCILPQLDLIIEVKILGPRYWPIVFHLKKNWNRLKLLLQNKGTVYIKQRAGYLSYVEDPKGYRSMLAKSLTSDHSSHCSVKPEVIKAFTSDSRILALTEYFMNLKGIQDTSIIQTLSLIVYECVTKEKPEVIPSHLSLNQSLDKSDYHGNMFGITQLKTVLAYYSSQYKIQSEGIQQEQLLKMEFLMSLKAKLENLLDKWQKDNMTLLIKYLQGESLKGQEVPYLSSYLMWFDVPTPEEISKIIVEGAPTLPVLCSNLPHLSVSTVMRILTAWTAAS